MAGWSDALRNSRISSTLSNASKTTAPPSSLKGKVEQEKNSWPVRYITKAVLRRIRLLPSTAAQYLKTYLNRNFSDTSKVLLQVRMKHVKVYFRPQTVVRFS